MAEWIEDERQMGMEMEDELIDEFLLDMDDSTIVASSACMESFEVTLDSILILPHWEVLDARIEALEERMPQRTLGETIEEKEFRKRKAEAMKLIQKEERRGLKRKKERERKRKLREEGKKEKVSSDDLMIDAVEHDDGDDAYDEEEYEEVQPTKKGNNANYNGPCVIYLSPNDESRKRLESLREKLCQNLFPVYDAFSPSSSVSPHPEQLPRKAKASSSTSSTTPPSQFRPMLPIARFSSVDAAVKIAKILQQTWDPLTFNVTDIQFISRDDSDVVTRYDSSDRDIAATASKSGVGFGKVEPDTNTDDTQRMALTSSGEVEDVTNQGIYGCDAMVMLWGEEPDSELMEEEASLSMIMYDEDDNIVEDIAENDNDDLDDVDDDETMVNGNGQINYNEIFTTAEREYQRMQAHEELSTELNEVPGFDTTITNNAREGKDIEAWLDDEDDGFDDEGATVVIGRAQFFMGAMREFVGMPASSAIDSKDRIMGGGISAVARRKGSVHRLAESWDAGDYGKKESDKRPKSPK